jgi:hypothetical protein
VLQPEGKEVFSNFGFSFLCLFGNLDIEKAGLWTKVLDLRRRSRKSKAMECTLGCIFVTYCHDHLVGALRLCQVIQGVGFPPPLTLIYRGLPPIKLLLFRAFLESFYFVTIFVSCIKNDFCIWKLYSGCNQKINHILRSKR